MKRIRDIVSLLTTNYQIKALALFCAVFLWFFVVTENVYEHVLEVPIRIRNLPEGRILLRPIPEKARVLFRGSGKAFLGMGFRDERIELDLTRAEDVTLIRLTPDLVKGTRHRKEYQPVQVLSPDSMWVYMDDLLIKRAPILPRFMVEPAEGFIQVGPIVLQPDSITIQGPASLVSPLSAVITQTRSFSGIARKTKGWIGLVPPESPLLVYSHSQAHYTINIQRLHEIEMTDVPVKVIHVPEGYRVVVIPQTLSLTLRGGVERLMHLKKEDIQATIDFESRYRYPDHRLPASIQVPPDVSFSNVHPKFFECILAYEDPGN